MKLLLLLLMLLTLHLTPEILSCSWLTSDQPECNNIAHGYIYNGPATSSLTVVIPSATEEHVGRYACQVVTVDHTAADIVPCNFTLEEESLGWIAAPVVGVLTLAIAAGLVWWKRRFISEKLCLRSVQ
ncbi:hypothetical protein BaRGS_00039178 [Batillaria attramentaria]|uniref:Ig-like domain-containing protein n=1 Tax=Batillaria attramentaria TaxID=370345 RepID=A0ABD0J3R6_9CAEN